jgi:hypothetical protein
MRMHHGGEKNESVCSYVYILMFVYANLEFFLAFKIITGYEFKILVLFVA